MYIVLTSYLDVIMLNPCVLLMEVSKASVQLRFFHILLLYVIH